MQVLNARLICRCVILGNFVLILGPRPSNLGPEFMRWDLFCNVVDNFGDIGVSWRLARQLAAEHGASVRLWVDDLVVFRRLAPTLDAGADVQLLGGIEVRRWFTPFPAVEPADVVVETFGCELPASYVEAMAARARPPVWINLEYLSAEPWVGGCHGLPSPHPRLPLTKYFFFPGFAPGTGGVLFERGLAGRRLAFQSDADGVARFLAVARRAAADAGRAVGLVVLLSAGAGRRAPGRLGRRRAPGARTGLCRNCGSGCARGARPWRQADATARSPRKCCPSLRRTITTGCCGPATGTSCAARIPSCVHSGRHGHWSGRLIHRPAMPTD